ncbi:MAG: inositol monophosphatase [Marinilabiliales bacterium]|nr:MAG: inositol monophosphatase [Marinilabiliales bacterium]
MNYETLCIKVTKIATEAGNFIRKEKDHISAENVKEKDLHSYVTYVDTETEKLIVSKLENIIPNAAFLTEEETIQNEQKEYTWIIDPLDGTTNYIHGLYPCSVSIALRHNDETVIGVVYEVGHNECFYTWKNGPAYLNGNEISVSGTQSLEKALVATGFPYYDYERLENLLQCLKHFMKNTHGVRRHGSAATDLAYVACGRYEAFFEYSLNPWDVAAGALIVKQAGGIVTDFSGENNYLFGQEIIASNKFVYSEFYKIIKESMF